MSRLTAWTRKLGVACSIAAVTILGVAAPATADPTNPAFYVDGELYGTVGTPTDFSITGAPSGAWDMIYVFGGAQPAVADSAPGYTDYAGGRWMVRAVTFPEGYASATASGDLDGDGVLDSVKEVEAALAAGSAVDTGVVRQFECPAIPLAGN